MPIWLLLVHILSTLFWSLLRAQVRPQASDRLAERNAVSWLPPGSDERAQPGCQEAAFGRASANTSVTSG